MTTQALTLVAPVPASAPSAAAAQPSPEADSFASVLASQHPGVEAKDGNTDSVVASASHTARDKQKTDSMREASKDTEDSSDSAFSMIATTLFIATESASIQQGLRQQITSTSADSVTPDDLLSHGKATDKLPKRPELQQSNTVLATTKQTLEPNGSVAMRLSSAITTPIPEAGVAFVETKHSSATAQPAIAKTEDTASLFSKASNHTKSATVTDAVKTVLASLPTAHTTVSTQTENASPAQEAPVVITPITHAASPLSSLATTGSSPVLQGSLTHPIDSPTWGQEFSKTILNFSRQGIQHAELRLDPPELGPLRISLKLSDNVAHAYIVSAHANVRQAVEQALPQLHHALAQSGLSLGHTDVSDQPSDHSFLFQQHSEGSSDSNSSSRFEDLLHGSSASSTEAVASPVRRAIPDALVDTFA